MCQRGHDGGNASLYEMETQSKIKKKLCDIKKRLCEYVTEQFLL